MSFYFVCFFLFFCNFPGIDKPNHSGSVWESVGGEVGALSNLRGVSPAVSEGAGWDRSGMKAHAQPV